MHIFLHPVSKLFLLHNLAVAGYAEPFNLYGKNVVSLAARNAGIGNAAY